MHWPKVSIFDVLIEQIKELVLANERNAIR